jgi:CRP-like cAMP-binding protein
VIKQILMFFFVVHLFSCVQFATSDAGFTPGCVGMTDGNREVQCWLYRANLLPVNISDPKPDGGTLYMASFFHTALQMVNGEVGLGGDPEFVHEYVLVLLSSLIGFFWQALIVASLTAFVEHLGLSSKQYRDNVDRLRQYAKRHKLPKDLRERLLFYYELRYPDGRYFDDQKVVDDLSRPLRLEMREHACSKVLDNLAVRPGTRTSHFLAENLTYRTFVINAKVIRQGFPPESMFFIVSGAAECVMEDPDGNRLHAMPGGQLGRGDFFGERELLNRSDPIVSVVVIDFLEAFELFSDAFDTLYANDPTFKALIDAGIIARREQLAAAAEEARKAKAAANPRRKFQWQKTRTRLSQVGEGAASSVASTGGAAWKKLSAANKLRTIYSSRASRSTTASSRVSSSCRASRCAASSIQSGAGAVGDGTAAEGAAAGASLNGNSGNSGSPPTSPTSTEPGSPTGFGRGSYTMSGQL